MMIDINITRAAANLTEWKSIYKGIYNPFTCPIYKPIYIDGTSLTISVRKTIATITSKQIKHTINTIDKLITV